MRAFKMADGLNRSTRRAGIFTCLPVFGLRPRRWRRSRTTKDPNEESRTGALETLLDFPKKGLDERGRLNARDMGDLIDGLSQMQPGNRFLDHIKARFTFDRPLRLDRCGSATLVTNRGSSHPSSFVGRQRRRTTRGHDDIATRARGAPTRNRVPCTGGLEGEVIGHTFFQNCEKAAQSCRFSTRAAAHDSILAAD
jgi:hypothetical protein